MTAEAEKNLTEGFRLFHETDTDEQLRRTVRDNMRKGAVLADCAGPELIRSWVLESEACRGILARRGENAQEPSEGPAAGPEKEPAAHDDDLPVSEPGRPSADDKSTPQDRGGLTAVLYKALCAAADGKAESHLHEAADACFVSAGIAGTDPRRAALLQAVLFPEAADKTAEGMPAADKAAAGKLRTLWVFEYFLPVKDSNFTICCTAIGALASFCAGLLPENAEIMFRLARKITDKTLPEKLSRDGPDGVKALQGLSQHLSEKYNLTSAALQSWLGDLADTAEESAEEVSAERKTPENIPPQHSSVSPAENRSSYEKMTDEMTRFVQASEEDRAAALAEVIDRYPALVSGVRTAMAAGIPTEDCEKCFLALVNTMYRDPARFLTEPVRAAFTDTFPFRPDEYPGRGEIGAIHILAVLSKFQNAVVQDAEGFEAAVSACSTAGSRNLLRCESAVMLCRLVMAGVWDDLPLLLTDYMFCYVHSFDRKRHRYAHLEVICSRRGIDALVELIDMYPQVSVNKSGSGTVRPGGQQPKARKAAGKWMKTDDDFYDALYFLPGSRDVFRQLCADELAVPKLVRALNDLVPDGAVQGRTHIVNCCVKLRQIWLEAFPQPGPEARALMKRLEEARAFEAFNPRPSGKETVVAAGRHYTGPLGTFDYDPGQFAVTEGHLHYIGHETAGKKIKIPFGVTDCSGMFSDCTGLQMPPVIPAGVTDCSAMFSGCTHLSKAPAIPAGVSSCRGMFKNCFLMTQACAVPVGVTDCSEMFSGCRLLLSVPALPAGVRNCSGMFKNCFSLTTAPFIPAGVTDCSEMYAGCKSLVSAPAVPPGVRNCRSMFRNCLSLKTVPAVMPGVTDCSMMFSGCVRLTKAPVLPAGVTDCSEMFSGCAVLPKAPVIQAGTEDCRAMFSGCGRLTKAPAIPAGVRNCSAMFKNCSALTKAPDIPAGVTDCKEMFCCTGLTAAPVIPAGVKNCRAMFYGCTRLTTPPAIPSDVTECSYMFCGCSSLRQRPPVPDGPSVNTENMFLGCP